MREIAEMFISFYDKTSSRNLSASGYVVVNPRETGAGQMYQSYCVQWMRWIVLNNPELNNYGPVYFLHCTSCPENQAGGGYGIGPVVRIGSQAISINKNEYVFLPVIMSAADSIDTPEVANNPMALLNYVRMDLQGGDNPPLSSQVKIAKVGGRGRSNLVEGNDLSRFHLISDVFPLDVPAAQDGASLLRTCFDIPINSIGVRDCVVGGWWILIQFNSSGTYYLHSYARGRGQYRAAMCYQIDVLGEPSEGVIERKTLAPDWSKSPILSQAKKKQESGELDSKQYDTVQELFAEPSATR